MTSTFNFTIRTPEKEIYNESVDSFHVKTELGDIEVYARHASLSGTIVFSPLKIKSKNQEEDFIIRRGMILFSNSENKATLLCLTCEKRKEISYQSTKDYLKFINEEMKKGNDLNEYQFKYLKNEKIALEHNLKSLDKEK